jgi:hypothetical protein
MQMKVFLSYRFADEPFVRSTNYYLTKQSDLMPYFFGDETHIENWVGEVSKALAEADAFVLFLGNVVGETQLAEAMAALAAGSRTQRETRVINLLGSELPSDLTIYYGLRGFQSIRVDALGEKDAQECARKITKSLGRQWVPVDDIPDEYVFDYEKDIIRAYSQDSIEPKLIDKGCPRTWPSVERQECRTESPLSEDDIGLFRDWNKNTKTFSEPLVLAGGLKKMAVDGIIKKTCVFQKQGHGKGFLIRRARVPFAWAF